MPTAPRTLFALVAAGRLTPDQAERLLTFDSSTRELGWILLAALLMPVLSGALGRYPLQLAQHLVGSLRHALPL